MFDVEQHPYSRKPKFFTKTNAPRYLNSYPFTPDRHIEKYANRPRLPGKWITVGCNAEARKHIDAHHVGNKSGCSSVREAYALGCSCCVNRGTYGNLSEFDLRQALRHRGGHSWAQVGRLIDRMLGCKIVRRARHAPHILQFLYYNDRPLKAQKKHESINRRPVSKRNNQVAYSSTKLGTYEEVETLMNARDAQAAGVQSQSLATPICEDFCFNKNKKILSTYVHASRDGIGRNLLPIAEQSFVQATAPQKPRPEQALPALPPSQQQLDKPPKADSKSANLSAKLGQLVRQGFCIPATLVETITARAQEPLPELSGQRVSEAWCRGFTRMHQTATGKTNKQQKLVPVRQTTATFMSKYLR